MDEYSLIDNLIPVGFDLILLKILKLPFPETSWSLSIADLC